MYTVIVILQPMIVAQSSHFKCEDRFTVQSIAITAGCETLTIRELVCSMIYVSIFKLIKFLLIISYLIYCSGAYLRNKLKKRLKKIKSDVYICFHLK